MADEGAVDAVDPAETWKKFLESTPANTSVKIPNLAVTEQCYAGRRPHLPKVRIYLHCSRDGDVRSFEIEADRQLYNTWDWKFISYTCRDCGLQVKTFAIAVVRADKEATDVEVMKLGEYPPFSAPISKRVEELLSKEDRELYRKGTRAEAQGLGIGAASYFRRIVESQWQQLVMEIRDAAARLGATDLSVYDSALAETQFSTAVRLLKDAIPQKLLILDGQNPLTVLHQPLSVQLHDLTDAECLQQAADIRVVLAALLENIADVLKDQRELKAAADRLSKRPPKS